LHPTNHLQNFEQKGEAIRDRYLVRRKSHPDPQNSIPEKLRNSAESVPKVPTVYLNCVFSKDPMAEGGVWREPVSGPNSLLTGNNTENFKNSALKSD
jgi:hypothetical protein